MSKDGFRTIISASIADRSDLFLSTANRLGVPLINIEKDFWVCWTLNALYHRLPAGGPRRGVRTAMQRRGRTYTIIPT